MIEILEEKIVHDGVRYYKGEQRSVTNEEREYFCAQGWAKDIAGEVATAERSTKPERINPETLKSEQK